MPETKLTDQDRLNIRKLWLQGYTAKEIVAKLNLPVKPSSVYNYAGGKRLWVKEKFKRERGGPK